MRFNLIASPQRYIDIALGLEGTVQGDIEMERASCAIEAVRRLLRDISIRGAFSSMKITEELLSTMADETLISGMHLPNPRAANKKDVIDIFRLLFQEG